MNMFFASLCLIAYTAGVAIFGIIVGIDIGFSLGSQKKEERVKTSKLSSPNEGTIFSPVRVKGGIR